MRGPIHQPERRGPTLRQPSDTEEPGFFPSPPGERAGDAVPAPAVVSPLASAAAPAALPAARRRIGAGLALSLLLHGAIAALVLLGPEAARVLPPVTDEPIEVVLVAPPPPARDEAQPAEEEGAQAEPPPPPAPEEEPAEEPAAEDAEQEEQPAAETPPEPQEPPLPQSETAAAPRVLIPVTEFAEEDSGGTERDGEIAARESADPPSEPTPDAGGEAQADETPAGTDTETGEGMGEPAGEAAPQEQAAAPIAADETADETAEETAGETPEQTADAPDAETEAEREAEPKAEREVAALTDPGRTETETATDVEVPEALAAAGDEIGDVIGEGIGLPRAKPEEIARLAEAPADPRARAEAVARAIAATTPGSGGLDFARPGRGAGSGSSGDLSGGTTATRLFSREISDDPRMRTAMNGMPHAARVDLLCMTELRAQLRVATPPYHADLLPSFRLESGTVLEPRRAAFRAGGQWYDLAFRCELNTQVTRVERFTFRVGAPVPRSEWSARGFPRN